MAALAIETGQTLFMRMEEQDELLVCYMAEGGSDYNNANILT